MSRYRPPLHVLCYGEPGSRKSSFAKTFPKPLLVQMFDPPGKAMPYMKDYSDRFLSASAVGPIQQWDLGGGLVVPYQDIQQEDGLVRIEYYNEVDIRYPKAAQTYRTRASIFYSEYANWASVAIDSVTGVEFIVRKQYEYVLLAGDKYDMRHWGGGSWHDIEELLMHGWASYPMNVIAIAHIHIKETGEVAGDLVRLLSLPGQLKKTAARSWPEFYRSYVGPDPSGSITGYLQTSAGNRFYAATQIAAPNPCEPYYWELWKGYPDE